MALKEYSSPKASKFVTIGGITREGDKNPTEIKGYYLGRTETDSQFDAGKKKITYMIQTKDGVVGVNGSANMNIKMEDSERGLQESGTSALGALVYIKFVGTQPSKKGNPTKLYQVMFDTDDRKDVDGGGIEEDETDLNDTVGEDGDETDYEPVAVAPRVRSARAQEVIAKVRAKSK